MKCMYNVPIAMSEKDPVTSSVAGLQHVERVPVLFSGLCTENSHKAFKHVFTLSPFH